MLHSQDGSRAGLGSYNAKAVGIGSRKELPAAVEKIRTEGEDLIKRTMDVFGKRNDKVGSRNVRIGELYIAIGTDMINAADLLAKFIKKGVDEKTAKVGLAKILCKDLTSRFEELQKTPITFGHEGGYQYDGFSIYGLVDFFTTMKSAFQDLNEVAKKLDSESQLRKYADAVGWVLAFEGMASAFTGLEIASKTAHFSVDDEPETEAERLLIQNMVHYHINKALAWINFAEGALCIEPPKLID